MTTRAGRNEESALLIIWHDIAAEMAEDYRRWHDSEHIPERLGIPGFRSARRYGLRGSAATSFLVQYEARALGTFSSPEYYERLNSPTVETSRIQPHFGRFLRVACEVELSIGTGLAGFLASVRYVSGPDAAAIVDVAAQVGATSTRVGRVRPDVTSAPSKEHEFRVDLPPDFDTVALVETSSPEAAEATLGLLAALAEPVAAASYELQFALPG